MSTITAEHLISGAAYISVADLHHGMYNIPSARKAYHASSMMLVRVAAQPLRLQNFLSGSYRKTRPSSIHLILQESIALDVRMAPSSENRSHLAFRSLKLRLTS